MILIFFVMFFQFVVFYIICLLVLFGYLYDFDVINCVFECFSIVQQCIENIEVMQWCFQCFGGIDGECVGDLNCFVDFEWLLLDIVFVVCGGYGVVCILYGFDYCGFECWLCDQLVVFVGYSDFMVIQLVLYVKVCIKMFGGLMLLVDFGVEMLSDFMMWYFWQMLMQLSMMIVVDVLQVQVVNVIGMLWGGNLVIFMLLVGMLYMFDIEGGILFIEDVNEQLFWIEWMIYQLYLLGLFVCQQVFVFGQFIGVWLFEYDNGYDMQVMIDQMCVVVGILVVMGFQFGYVFDLLMLLFGVQV